jgi:glyoxylase-like metal-dependent hydrolase (beta-lactamase superfamily II)
MSVLQPSRRGLIAGLAALPAAAAAPALIGAAAALAPAAARAAGRVADVPPVMRLRVGRFRVHVVSDGFIDFPHGIFTGIPEADVRAAARAAGIDRPTGIRSGFTQWLVEGDGRLVLVDAGPAGTVAPDTGRLPAALAALGVAPADIDAAVVTHLHVDHVSGFVAGGRRAFPNARVFADRRDVAHFTDPAKAAAAPELLKSSFEAARRLVELHPDLERIDLPAGGERELAPGISLVDLAGHTPGQVGVRIADGGESLLLASDMLFHPTIHPAHAGIGILFEADKPAADAARARFFQAMAAEGGLVAATHMPFPGVGRIVRDGGALAWRPADWDLGA